MSARHHEIDLVAACAFGLESLVAMELGGLGYKHKILGNGRVLFRAGARAMARANLWLRTADRVLVRLATFPADDFGQLFEGTRAIAWEEWIPPNGEFPVAGRSVKSRLSSVPACQKIAKKAIVERLKAAHRRTTLDETGSKFPVEVAVVDNEASLWLDTTGPSLHKRGYRTLVAAAQLKETLAAALVLLANWQPDQPLADSFCGSGTIPIEAALIAHRRAPGVSRTFLAEEWPAIPARLWHDAREEARSLARRPSGLTILASDIDADVLRLANYHATKADVADLIQFRQADATALGLLPSGSVLVTNPPYGERLGGQVEVTRLYRRLRDSLTCQERCAVNVLTANSRLERLWGVKADSKRKLFNGQIECRYFQYGADVDWSSEPVAPAGAPDRQIDSMQHAADDGIGDPSASGLARAKSSLPNLGRTAGGDPIQVAADLFSRRLSARARHLRRWPGRRGITCYRVYDRDIPEIPLSVDRYEDWLRIEECARPHDRDPATHARWLAAMVSAAAQTLGVPVSQVGFVAVGDARLPLHRAHTGPPRGQEVREGGLSWLVNLTEYADTGLFLVHRWLRGQVRELARGKRVLDLFAYTGGFSVAAVAGGAAGVTTVDLHEPHLAWARHNVDVNALSTTTHRFERADGLSFVEALDASDRYDLAIVNPPFVGDRLNGSAWSLVDDGPRVVERLLPHLAPGAMVFWISQAPRAPLVGDWPGIRFREITRQSVPEDFACRRPRFHRAWRGIVG